MAKRKFKAHLDPEEINHLISSLNRYADRLEDSCETFIRRLTDVGIPIIERRINASMGDSLKAHKTYLILNENVGVYQGTLVVEGRDILFIEFGAGIHFNTPAGTSPHPKGAEKGYTIGSYGSGQGANMFWFYETPFGGQISYGTEATMPVYSAYLEMKNKVLQIAKEVFSYE